MGNIIEVKYNCATNGVGIRTAVYLAGCNLHCEGCFNQEAWNFNSGKKAELFYNKILDSLKSPSIDGLSILGGEPLDPKNQETTLSLIYFAKSVEKTVWLFTGYTWDKIPKTEFTKKILQNTDVIIEGPFQQKNWKPNLYFRGSSNQRLLTNAGKYFVDESGQKLKIQV